MTDDHLYIVTYDIADPKRWRVVFRIMNGYGEWLQLSVFQCRLSRRRHAELVQRLKAETSSTADHVMIIDVGPAATVRPRVISLGKKRFNPIEHKPLVI